MEKIIRIRDIPQLTQDGAWECDFTPLNMLRQLDEWVNLEGLDLDPDFQRGHVWSQGQQQAYIEFFLRGGRTARVIYLNHTSWRDGNKGDFVLVDGKQRVQAWRAFINDEFQIFGSYYREFEDRDSLGRPGRTMKINVNDLKTRAHVLQWYIDMNAGGTPHTRDEIEKVRNLLAQE